MKESSSYTQLEKQLIHKYRNSLNQAESVEDVKKFFSYTMLELINKAFDNQLSLHLEDIQLGQDEERPFIISNALQQQEAFARVWSGSDLPLIISRLATPARNRFSHLQTHPEKTKAKIHRH